MISTSLSLHSPPPFRTCDFTESYFQHLQLLLDMNKRPMTSKGDDRETPTRALRDIVQLLHILRPSSPHLHIYDPYYCQGSIKTRLADLGYTNVYNEPVDFYQAIEHRTLPSYDVLLTNPPYSGTGNHIRRALEFACRSKPKPTTADSTTTTPLKQHPWCMLLPSNVYTREWYDHVIRFEPSPPVFLCPHERYAFVVPSSSDSKTPEQTHVPYVTMWFVGGLSPSERATLLATWGSSSVKTSTTLAGTSDALPRRVRKLMKYNTKKKQKKSNTKKKDVKRKKTAAATATTKSNSSNTNTNTNHKRLKRK